MTMKSFMIMPNDISHLDEDYQDGVYYEEDREEDI